MVRGLNDAKLGSKAVRVQLFETPTASIQCSEARKLTLIKLSFKTVSSLLILSAECELAFNFSGLISTSVAIKDYFISSAIPSGL